MFALVFTLTSCHQDDETAPLHQEKSISSGMSSKAPLAWSYTTNSWSTSGGIFVNKCYNAQGTNQTTKRSVVTVTNEGYSAEPVHVTITTSTNSCIFSGGIGITTFTVNAGQTFTYHINVNGHPSNETKVYVRIQPNSSGSDVYAGLTTFGYEY